MPDELVRLATEEDQLVIRGTNIVILEAMLKPWGKPKIVSDLNVVSNGEIEHGDANAYMAGESREVLTSHGRAVYFPVQLYTIRQDLVDAAKLHYSRSAGSAQ